MTRVECVTNLWFPSRVFDSGLVFNQPKFPFPPGLGPVHAVGVAYCTSNGEIRCQLKVSEERAGVSSHLNFTIILKDGFGGALGALVMASRYVRETGERDVNAVPFACVRSTSILRGECDYDDFESSVCLSCCRKASSSADVVGDFCLTPHICRSGLVSSTAASMGGIRTACAF